MTDKAWADGMAEFQRVGMPGWPYDDPAVSLERAQAYRRHLDVLSDAEWLYAVAQSIAACKWFPTVHELLACGDAYMPRLAMLPPARTPLERERDRETAARGIELIRQAAGEVGLDLPKSGANVVIVTDERKRELREMLQRVTEAVK